MSVVKRVEEHQSQVGISDKRTEMWSRHFKKLGDVEAKRILNLSFAGSYLENLFKEGKSPLTFNPLLVEATRVNETETTITTIDGVETEISTVVEKESYAEGTTTWLIDVLIKTEEALKDFIVKRLEAMFPGFEEIPSLTPPQFYTVLGDIVDFIAHAFAQAADIITITTDKVKREKGNLKPYLIYFAVQANLKKCSRHGYAWHWLLKGNAKDENRKILDEVMPPLRKLDFTNFQLDTYYTEGSVKDLDDVEMRSPVAYLFRVLAKQDGVIPQKVTLDALMQQDTKMQVEELQERTKYALSRGGKKN